jgi:hypothetical protein
MTFTHTVLHNCHRQHCMTSPGTKQTGLRLKVWNLFGKFLDHIWPEESYFFPWHGISVPCYSLVFMCTVICVNCNASVLLLPVPLYFSFQCDHPCYRILLRTCNLKNLTFSEVSTYQELNWKYRIMHVTILQYQQQLCNFIHLAKVDTKHSPNCAIVRQPDILQMMN